MDAIKFVDSLPPTAGQPGKHDELIDALKARPNQWALVWEGPANERNRTNPGPYAALHKRGCRTAQRTGYGPDGAKVVRVYAMWPDE